VIQSNKICIEDQSSIQNASAMIEKN